MKIAAIARNPKNSPQMCDKDQAILLSTAEMLIERGNNVLLLTEEQYASDNNTYDIIISMSRSNHTLKKLSQALAKGTIVVNTPQAVENCSREIFVGYLERNNIPQPTHKLLKSEDKAPTSGYPIWIKKSKGWSEHKDDVCYAHTHDEAAKALINFKKRGVEEVLICNHINGDIIKFYGIGDDFFEINYPNPNDTKFGLEKINGAPNHYPLDKEKLHKIALSAAHCIGVEIFGGDAIITPDGNIYIIDINDFPSFSAVRSKAAQAISNLIKIKNNEYRR